MNIQFALFGDLNCWHESWSCHKNNKRGNMLFDAIKKNNCHISYSFEPTRYASGKSNHDSWLDLMIDHEGIIAVIKTPIQHNKTISKDTCRYNFEKTTKLEFTKYKQHIEQSESKFNITREKKYL